MSIIIIGYFPDIATAHAQKVWAWLECKDKMASSEKVREKEGMFVTVVCQRCSTPIRLHKTLQSSELIKVATGLTNKVDKQVIPHLVTF